MEPITYRLNPDGPAASTYYSSISRFTDKVLTQAEGSIAPLARSYRRFLAEYELEELRSLEEYTFELLNLGILWRAYGGVALTVEIAPFRSLSYLAEWRKKHQRLKPAIDVVRGVVMTFFLAPANPKGIETPPRDLGDLERLVRWLDATGDFREDALRFVRWLAFWASLDRERFAESMTTVLTFADWFDEAAEEQMGMYTRNVTSFVRDHTSSYRWREDRFSCLRSRVEYHLNMVGAEIMNRAFRQEFLAAERKTVLLPGCMRFHTAEACEGTKTKEGIRCSGCQPSCRVNQIRLLGLREHFDVMVIPHSSDLSLWGRKTGEPENGVVGVACLSVLVQGGWELKRHGAAAQCVLLNECGCKKHWHREGFPTQLDMRELKRIIKPKQPASFQPAGEHPS